MSGAMRKIGEYLGLLEDTGRYDESAFGDETSEVPAIRPGANLASVQRAEVAQLAEKRKAKRPVMVAAPAPVPEVARIVPVQPTTYNDARTVGEQFRDGNPVIMNLTEMDDADAKRLVDFAAGLVFAAHGSIERITNKVFLLSPANIHVGAEARERMAQSGFFNQS
jgi:cell division inhibitor SepF